AMSSRGRSSKAGQPPSKKSKPDEDDQYNMDIPEDTFDDALEEELMLEMQEEELLSMETGGPIHEEDLKLEVSQSRVKKWRRSEPKPLNPDKDSLIFQQLDIDNYIGGHFEGMPGAISGLYPLCECTVSTTTGTPFAVTSMAFTPISMFLHPRASPKTISRGFERPSTPLS
ncbi:DNA polymerase, partial [Caligus rogercresseyi]